jgi:D-alanine-D-alanine ligase-like ATP-grasp enzyme
MFNIANNFFLLKTVYHMRRLRALLPRRNSAPHLAEQLREDFYEKLWEDTAAEVGASCKRLGYGICEISRDGLVTRVRQNCTAIDDPVTLTIALNKVLVNKMLAEEGLPIPRHVAFTLRTLPRAIAFLEKGDAALLSECVVKPASGTGGGQGITTGIRTRSQLAWAATLAAQDSSEMLLEEQIPGDNYRLLYLDGVLLDAVQRRPPSVTGDGHSTIRQLVDAVNAGRLSRGSTRSQVLISIDMDLRNTLARQGLTPASVPPAGAIIPVKTVINQNFAADNVTVTDRLCPSVIADGAHAARVVGVRLAGIDIITPDPTVPLVESGGVILEVNTTPGFHYHYHKNDGSFPVAVHVLEKLLSELASKCGVHSAECGVKTSDFAHRTPHSAPRTTFEESL